MAGTDDSGEGGGPGFGDIPARHPQRATPPGEDEPKGVQPIYVTPTKKPSELHHPIVTVEPAEVRVQPGTASELKLSITNRSDTINEFTVELDAAGVGWIRIEPPSKKIWTNQSESFRIVVDPPHSAQVLAGRKEYGLTIRSAAIPDGVAVASIRVEVLPFEAIETRLRPRTSTAFRRATHRLEIRNLGSAPWSAGVEASDPQDALRIDAASRVTVPPNDQVSIPISVRPKRWHWFGSTIGHAFAVSLNPDSGTRVRVDGGHDQLPVIPNKVVLPLVAAVFLVAVGARAAGIWKDDGAAGSPPPGSSLTAGGPTLAPVTFTPPSNGDTAAGPTDPSSPPSDETETTSPATATPTPTTPPTPTPTADPTPTPDPTPTATPAPTIAPWAIAFAEDLTADGVDIGNPSGTTHSIDQGIAEMQAYQNVTMYRIADGNKRFVIREPVLTRFRELGAGTGKPPKVGYPIDNRRKDAAGVSYQRFEEGTIQCSSPNVCYVLPKAIYSLWQPVKSELRYPNAKSSFSVQRGTVQTFEAGRISINLTGKQSVCDMNGDSVPGSSVTCGFDDLVVGPIKPISP